MDLATTTEIQALDAALTAAIQAAATKGEDAHHTLHLHGRGETGQVDWEARRCGADVEVVEALSDCGRRSMSRSR
ncbi:hypothetical protein SAMN05421543_1416 [Alicyclobacillus macrosporangiidus]|uniref:Uncharacterized protein n=1 Tax=Alicyclobacillus macrosporangiidus TaxID=392015 RepID=A0A1I7LEC4_9BACL|nr:hypothetical protein SAMN05421543_1416 [Alicyclobacillus macrosporangiidus]